MSALKPCRCEGGLQRLPWRRVGSVTHPQHNQSSAPQRVGRDGSRAGYTPRRLAVSAAEESATPMQHGTAAAKGALRQRSRTCVESFACSTGQRSHFRGSVAAGVVP